MNTGKSEKVDFAQIDAHLDTNPKIRKAGRHGRDVFEFVLRRVAIMRTAGVVPVKYVADWYLADALMMPVEDAVTGVTAAVTSELIDIDEAEGLVYVVGWTDEWGRKRKSGAERQASYRERNKLKPVGDVTRNRHSLSPVTVSDKSDTIEEKRRDKKKKLDPALPAPISGSSPVSDHQFVRLEFFAYFAKQAGSEPTWNQKHGGMLKQLLAQHSRDEILRRLRILVETPPKFPPPMPPWDFATFVQHFDKIATAPTPSQQFSVAGIREIPRL